MRFRTFPRRLQALDFAEIIFGINGSLTLPKHQSISYSAKFIGCLYFIYLPELISSRLPE